MKNILLLFLTATIWGTAFVAQSVGMDHVGPFTFTFARSIVGGLFLIPCIWFLRKINGKKENYEATTTRDNPNIEFYTTDNITLEDMNIEINKYKSKKKLINDVKKYIIKENGSCN